MRAVAVASVFSVAACSVPAAVAQHASQSQVPAPPPARAPSHAKKPAAATSPAHAPSDASTNQLEQLTRALKQKNPAAAYAKLSAFALQKSSGALGNRAALALGYFDYGKAHYPQSANWLKMAQSDVLLRDYALYWSSQANLALNHDAEALAQLQEFRKDYPDSVVTDQALQSLSVAALAVSQPAPILAALDGYPQKLFGLTIRPDRLQQIRNERKPDSRYSSAAQVAFEVRAAESLFERHGVPVLDATEVSIEEISTRILDRMGLERRLRP